MILVTGATGHIGRAVTTLLLAAGERVRAMARDPAKLAAGDAEPVAGDYADPDSLDRAFAGVDRALIVSGYAPPGERARLHGNAIAAARRAGVGFIAYTSFQGASPQSRFPMARDHAETELLLEGSGVPFAALRDNFYLDLLPEMFGADGVLRGPGASGSVAWVARSDVARTIVAILREPAGKSGTFDVTGPESLTLAESATRLAALTGRTLTYEPESVEAGRVWRAATGAPEWEVDTWLGSYEAIAAGEVAAVSATVEAITRAAPVGFEEYFRTQPQLLASVHTG
jgi:uncharacterized protein YbjT (DUF2867 family)